MDLVAEDLPRWQADAACLDADPAVFFPEKGASTGPAKAICETCTVAEPCLRLALDEGHDVGVWGGMSPRERARLARHAA